MQKPDKQQLISSETAPEPDAIPQDVSSASFRDAVPFLGSEIRSLSTWRFQRNQLTITIVEHGLEVRYVGTTAKTRSFVVPWTNVTSFSQEPYVAPTDA